MQVLLRGGQMLMPQGILNNQQVSTLIQAVRGKSMTQSMSGEISQKGKFLLCMKQKYAKIRNLKRAM